MFATALSYVRVWLSKVTGVERIARVSSDEAPQLVLSPPPPLCRYWPYFKKLVSSKWGPEPWRPTYPLLSVSLNNPRRGDGVVAGAAPPFKLAGGEFDLVAGRSRHVMTPPMVFRPNKVPCGPRSTSIDAMSKKSSNDRYSWPMNAPSTTTATRRGSKDCRDVGER